MFNVIASYQCPYIMMHMQGRPQNMQDNPKYNNPTKEIISFLAKRVKSAREKKIIDIIIDKQHEPKITLATKTSSK